MIDMELSAAIGLEYGIVACVGAGGKTSVLLSLAKELQSNKLSFLLTSTTKMFYHQVAGFAPIFTPSPQEGWDLVKAKIKQGRPTAWFKARQGDKVVGLEKAWLDTMPSIAPYILVEADGAQQKLVKAPGSHEPVVPVSSSITIGVLNIRAVGLPCTEETVNRLQNVLSLTGLTLGQNIRQQDLAKLAGHPQGIFKNSYGRKVLVINGWNIDEREDTADLFLSLQRYNTVGMERYVLAAGYGDGLKVIRSGLLA